jgi:hypothetical protein
MYHNKNNKFRSQLLDKRYGLPDCNISKNHTIYWKDYWASCISDVNKSQQECCDGITCANPKSIGLPCVFKKKESKGGHFGFHSVMSANSTKQDNKKKMFIGVW